MSITHYNIKRILYPISGPLILIIFWILINKFNLVNPLYLPSLKDVTKRIFSFLLGDGIYAIYTTLYRTFFPIFLLFFGVGDVAKIAISSFAVFWILLVNTIYGVWGSSAIRLKVAKLFKASKYKIFTNVIIFDALPQIMIGIRLSISIPLIITIVSEMFIGTQYGLGKVIYDSYVSYDTTQLFATIFVVGVLGYIINKLFIVFEKKTIHWVGK